MFAVTITGPDGVTRLEIDTPEVTIGRARSNGIVLSQTGISRHHARLVTKDNKFILVDLKSSNGTFVNGKRLTAPVIVRESDEIVIGDYTLTLECELEPTLIRRRAPYLPADDVEAKLLDALAGAHAPPSASMTRGTDDASRLVYADWLEDRGETARAEFLRVQHELVAMAPEDDRFRDTSARLRELAGAIDVRWRIRVARPAIERCDVKFDFACPREWGALARTDRDDVRHCGACNKAVRYCATVGEARMLAARGACVALDVGAMRWSDDLAPPYGQRMCPSCELDVGDGPRTCPRCGDAMPRRQMMVGMIA